MLPSSAFDAKNTRVSWSKLAFAAILYSTWHPQCAEILSVHSNDGRNKKVVFVVF